MSEVHFGEWLRAKIESSGISKKEFAESLRLNPTSLRAWFTRPKLQARAHTIVLLGKQIGISPEELRRRFGSPKKLKAPPTPENEAFDGNVDPYSEQKVYDIPTFELSVSAGTWTDVSEIGETADSLQIDHGRFRIRIAGDSMEEKFPNGSVVEFVCITPARPALEIGRHYYVQKDDGTATFKTLKKITEEELILVAINKKKYPNPMPVSRQQVVRMALAESIIIPA